MLALRRGGGVDTCPARPGPVGRPPVAGGKDGRVTSAETRETHTHTHTHEAEAQWQVDTVDRGRA